MDYKRKLMLKSKSLQRLCKDLRYYEKELSAHQTSRANQDLDAETHRQTDKFILESTRTIDAVQTSIETMLEEFEDVLKIYKEQNQDHPEALEACDSYKLAKETYATLPDYGIEIDPALFP